MVGGKIKRWKCVRRGKRETKIVARQTMWVTLNVRISQFVITFIQDASPSGWFRSLPRPKYASSRSLHYTFLLNTLHILILLRDNARKITLRVYICVVCVCIHILYIINLRFANIGTWSFRYISTSRERTNE